jgi:flavin-dependent dehydrogenase
MRDTEVLVVGGGPSGLLAASKLSLRHKVALIERGKPGTTNKFWVTTERRLTKHDLSMCVLSKRGHMSASTFLGSEAHVEGDFAVVDDSLLL